VIGFVVRRLLWGVVLALVITFCTFLLFFVVPTEGAGRVDVRGGERTTIAEVFELQRTPVPQQYAEFLWGIVRHGSLGYSLVDREPVVDTLARTVPVTASLVIGGAVVWLLIALPLGVFSALRPRSLLDRVGMIAVFVGVSAHPAWLGLILSYVFGYKLRVTPLGGYCDFFYASTGCGGPVQWAYHLLLPWLTFAVLFAALYARMVRASVLESLDEDYVRTARAKGASRSRTLRVHVLRNAMLPVVTMLGMDVGLAFGGALFVESVYGLPGVGRTMIGALARSDLPVILGIVLVVTAAVLVFNLVVDLLYAVLDPRVRTPAHSYDFGERTPAPPTASASQRGRVIGESAREST
jgi:peptide/nickel transport system permease protein